MDAVIRKNGWLVGWWRVGRWVDVKYSEFHVSNDKLNNDTKQAFGYCSQPDSDTAKRRPCFSERP